MKTWRSGVQVAFPSSEDVVFPNDPTVLLKASAHASAPTSSEPEGRSATHPGTSPMCVCASAGPLVSESESESESETENACWPMSGWLPPLAR